jgi:hypothetical protein
MSWDSGLLRKTWLCPDGAQGGSCAAQRNTQWTSDFLAG